MDVDGSTSFIDVEHEDSLGIFVLLENFRIFSFSGPTISKADGITEIAPVYSIFPEQFLVHFPRFKARIIFSCQEINLASEDHIGLSSNIGEIRGVPTDQYNGEALTSAKFNLVSQHIQGTTSQEAAQQTLERKILNLEMTKVHALKCSSVYRCFERYQASLQVGREDGVSSQLKTIGRRAHGRRDTAPYPVFVCRGELTGATELRGRIRNFLLLFPFCFPCSFSVL